MWAWAGGPLGVWTHRTINTLDAMIGHRNQRYQQFGWAAAKTDDIANWLPARLTVLAIAAAKATLPTTSLPNSSIKPNQLLRKKVSDTRHIIQTAIHHGRHHPSPNGGRVEAAFAASLGITLGGTNVYNNTVEHRSQLGFGPPPSHYHITQAVTLARRTVVIACIGPAIGITIVNWLRRK